MNWVSSARVAVVCAILIVLQYSVPALLQWKASVDFMVIALLFGAVRLRPGMAAVYGFLLGLVADSLEPTGFGAAALGMTVVAFTASSMKAVFFADHPALNALFLFLGKWLFDTVFVLSGHRGAMSDMVMQLFVWSPLSAAVTAVVGTLALALLRPVMEMRTS